MNVINRFLQKKILGIIGFVYSILVRIPHFDKVMPYDIFRYGVAGSANLVFDWVLYFVCYNFVFRHEIFRIGPIAISAHVASLLVTFPITFLSGFWLAKFISFKESGLKSGIQLFRYLLVVAICLLINYMGLKFLVEVLGFYPTPSKMLITVVATLFSYLSQKYFTFKAK